MALREHQSFFNLKTEMSKMKKVVLKCVNGIYKIPWFLKIYAGKRKYYFEYKGKLYDKEIKTNDKKVMQVSLLVNALNIRNKNERLSFIYDKSCDFLDEDFIHKNVCEFKCRKCIQDRLYNNLGGGCCCDSKNHSAMCPYLTKNGCSIKCLACKFHICKTLKKKGYKYHVNDIYMLKYLLNWKQKIMIYNDFFMTKDEVLKDLIRNSIIIWSFSKRKEFVKYNIK